MSFADVVLDVDDGKGEGKAPLPSIPRRELGAEECESRFVTHVMKFEMNPPGGVAFGAEVCMGALPPIASTEPIF